MNTLQSRLKRRSERGASTVVLTLALAFFVIVPLALFGFEMSRYLLVQNQLQSVSDAAALAGTAGLASAAETDASGNPIPYATREGQAMDAAIGVFQLNSVMRTQFAYPGNVTVYKNTNTTSFVPSGVALHNAVINITLLDQNAKQVTTGTPATTMRIQSWYTEAPLFTGAFNNLGAQYTASAVSNGGLPALDLMMAFDVSGSMDDATPIMLVKRYWDSTNNQMVWQQISNTPSFTTLSGVNYPNNTIYTTFQPPNTGTAFNIYPPQNLSFASYHGGTTSNAIPYQWSETNVSPYNNANGLRSDTTQSTTGPYPEQGLRPGNLNPANAGKESVLPSDGAEKGIFTDCVIDMTNGGQNPFPVTYNGFTFNSFDMEVEASRGNMEDLNSLKKATNNNPPAGWTPKAGYFNAYWNYVLNNMHPIQEARLAAYNFFNTMNISANCHFGFVTFADTVGTLPSSQWTGTTLANTNVTDANYASGGTTNWNSAVSISGPNSMYPMPFVPMQTATTSGSNFDAVTQGIMGGTTITPTYTALTALGGTDIYDAEVQCFNYLTNPTYWRKSIGAKPAVILFTDGTPNKPSSVSLAETEALNEATTLGNAPVPVYTIGLSQNASVKPTEDQLLGDNNNGSGKGIAYLSGKKVNPGPIYVSVTNPTQLENAFQQIARSLCAIQ